MIYNNLPLSYVHILTWPISSASMALFQSYTSSTDIGMNGHNHDLSRMVRSNLPNDDHMDRSKFC